MADLIRMPFSDYQDCGEKIFISKWPKSDEFALNLSVQAVKLDIPACMNATLHFFCREVFFQHTFACHTMCYTP